MKKTITINIAGLVFNIEEDAYATLKVYLENIGNKFQNLEERQEIMEDIEARIAELFNEKLNRNKEVIHTEDVKNIISVMGSPDNFEEEEKEADFSKKKKERKSFKRRDKKKFYRDSDDFVLGGICSGLANFNNWNVSYVRIVFAISLPFFGSGLWLYLLIWLVTPAAKSTSEKLAMEGKNANVENIKKFVTKVKDNIENLDTDQIGENIKQQSKNFNDFLVGTSKKFNDSFRPKENINAFFNSIFSFIGFVLISIGIILFLSFVYSIFQTSTNGINSFLKDFASHFNMNILNIGLVKIGVFILFLSTAISILLSGIRLAFKKQNNIIQKTKPAKRITRFAIIFSIIGLVALLIFNKISYSNFSINESQDLDYKTIVVRKLDIATENKNTEKIKFNVRKTSQNKAWVTISMKGNGFRSISNVLDNKTYEYNLTDSILELSPYINSNGGMYFENKVAVTLYIPNNDSTILINEFDE